MFCTKNLPENEVIFNQAPVFANLNSPYEAAKRLSNESGNLVKTGEKYLRYLRSLHNQDEDTSDQVTGNYETEFDKLETICSMLHTMINDHKTRLQTKLTDNMTK